MQNVLLLLNKEIFGEQVALDPKYCDNSRKTDVLSFKFRCYKLSKSPILSQNIKSSAGKSLNLL